MSLILDIYRKDVADLNRFLIDGTLTEQTAGGDFVYIINDPTCVAADEYNLITEGRDETFANVMYGNFNGQNAFYYVVNNLKSISELAEGLTLPRFIEIVKDFLGIVIKTKESNILKEENIITSLSRIYIDPKTKKVKGVYAPVIQKVPVKAVLFENEVRDVFARFMKKQQNLQGDRADDVIEWLMDENLSITEVYDKLSEEDKELYQAYYCGLCRNLQKRHSKKSALILAYDPVFLALLYNGLYEEPEERRSRYCLHKAEKVPLIRGSPSSSRIMASTSRRTSSEIRSIL